MNPVSGLSVLLFVVTAALVYIISLAFPSYQWTGFVTGAGVAIAAAYVVLPGVLRKKTEEEDLEEYVANQALEEYRFLRGIAHDTNRDMDELERKGRGRGKAIRALHQFALSHRAAVLGLGTPSRDETNAGAAIVFFKDPRNKKQLASRSTKYVHVSR